MVALGRNHSPKPKALVRRGVYWFRGQANLEPSGSHRYASAVLNNASMRLHAFSA
jgi:hypothetical protein